MQRTCMEAGVSQLGLRERRFGRTSTCDRFCRYAVDTYQRVCCCIVHNSSREIISSATNERE